MYLVTAHEMNLKDTVEHTASNPGGVGFYGKQPEFRVYADSQRAPFRVRVAVGEGLAIKVRAGSL
jgi:hypothetical protein